MTSSPFRISLVVAGIVIAQISIVGRFEVAGVHPDLLLLVPIAAGLTAGSERAAVMGFFVGLIADLFSETPFGLTAMTFALVGWMSGFMHGRMLRAPIWLQAVFAFCGSAAGILIWVSAASVLGQNDLFSASLLNVIIVVGLANALASPPIVKLFGWAYVPVEARPAR